MFSILFMLLLLLFTYSTYTEHYNYIKHANVSHEAQIISLFELHSLCVCTTEPLLGLMKSIQLIRNAAASLSDSQLVSHSYIQDQCQYSGWIIFRSDFLFFFFFFISKF